MSKSFIELEKQYQKLSYELRHTLEKLAYYCSNFSNGEIEFEGVEYINNPFELGYGEEYLSHWVVNEEDMLYANFKYEDPYDDYDTNSHIKYPLHWVEHAYNNTLEEIDNEIKSEILKSHYTEVNIAKRDAIFQAKEFGLITEEQAAEKLAEISGKN